MPDLMGEQVDRLITIELKNRGMPHGFLRALYEAAREEGGGRPLTTRAAEGLKQHVGEGDRVLILTGAGYPPVMPQGESDGPPGAAVLARMLYWGLGAVPIYVCEPMHVDPIVASSEAADVMVFPPEHAIGRHHGGALLASPTDQGAIEGWAKEIYDRFQPKAIVATEKLSRAADGKVYNATGQVKGPETGITDLSAVMEEATRRGIFSIGIGDHGNEIGFGRLQDAVHRLMPAGRVNCSVVPTDVLLPCMMSNWGCYGIAAVLAFLLGRADLVHGPAQEERIVRACLEAGGLEAMMCTKRFIVDGAEGESGMAVVQLMGDMVRLALSRPSRGVAH